MTGVYIYMCQHLIKPYITEMMAGLNPICFVHLHVKPLSDRQLQVDGSWHLRSSSSCYLGVQNQKSSCCQGEITLSKQDYIWACNVLLDSDPGVRAHRRTEVTGQGILQ